MSFLIDHIKNHCFKFRKDNITAALTRFQSIPVLIISPPTFTPSSHHGSSVSFVTKKAEIVMECSVHAAMHGFSTIMALDGYYSSCLTSYGFFA
jgi:hypothetical protein